ncbi:hypothetical protein LOAG_07715 [Loa loa]|uniref:Uncharacterized protein n=1 Tax=Loa loa TaxID=7209 RepID=A0A1S0TV69_LOALO|nr:hypothetical protein LOAG_07715 [Loa loa]EFO20776.1 hypothetical protein LOAG_07715 [Loa loa]
MCSIANPCEYKDPCYFNEMTEHIPVNVPMNTRTDCTEVINKATRNDNEGLSKSDPCSTNPCKNGVTYIAKGGKDMITYRINETIKTRSAVDLKYCLSFR